MAKRVFCQFCKITLLPVIIRHSNRVIRALEKGTIATRYRPVVLTLAKDRINTNRAMIVAIVLSVEDDRYHATIQDANIIMASGAPLGHRKKPFQRMISECRNGLCTILACICSEKLTCVSCIAHKT